MSNTEYFNKTVLCVERVNVGPYEYLDLRINVDRKRNSRILIE